MSASRHRAGNVSARLLSATFAAIVGLTAGAGPTPTASVVAASPTPVVLAYYYIWYEARSWDRAKTDLPQLGRYASRDAAIIAQHVAWAKAAGIDAFIVSWKHEPRLDEPLAALVFEARKAGLGLVLLYQGLDFNRNPLEPQRITDDLIWFMSTYGDDPVFSVFGPPTIILSGTPSFSDEEVAAVRSAVLDVGPARFLGSDRSGDDYAPRSEFLDGAAYYWSSVDPGRDLFYRDRLQDLAARIRADDGLWIAPVAPGFDAREVGGTRVVDRADGETLRIEWQTALDTQPDGLGIISWNEFSENSQIEPSLNYGTTYLSATAALVRDTLGRPAAVDPARAAELATAAPATAGPSAPSVAPPREPALVAGEIEPLAIAVLLIVGLALIARRSRSSTFSESRQP